MSLKPGSRAYDPSYTPTKPLERLVQENPQNQFLVDRMAEQHAALKENMAQDTNLSPANRSGYSEEPPLS